MKRLHLFLSSLLLLPMACYPPDPSEAPPLAARTQAVGSEWPGTRDGACIHFGVASFADTAVLATTGLAYDSCNNYFCLVQGGACQPYRTGGFAVVYADSGCTIPYLNAEQGIVGTPLLSAVPLYDSAPVFMVVSPIDGRTFVNHHGSDGTWYQVTGGKVPLRRFYRKEGTACTLNDTVREFYPASVVTAPAAPATTYTIAFH